MTSSPLYPLTVHWLRENETEVFATPELAEMDLEFFDTDDGEALVTDREGRLVDLKIDFLEIVKCELKDDRERKSSDHRSDTDASDS